MLKFQDPGALPVRKKKNMPKEKSKSEVNIGILTTDWSSFDMILMNLWFTLPLILNDFDPEFF